MVRDRANKNTEAFNTTEADLGNGLFERQYIAHCG